MRKFLAVVGCVLALGVASAASAAPLDPTPPLGGIPLGGQIAGEGAAPNTCIISSSPACLGAPASGNPNAVQHVDWIVVHDGNPNGGFTYYYQLENGSVAPVISMAIDSKAFVAAGFILGVDLDDGIPVGTVVSPGTPAASSPVIAPAVLGHNAGNFANLAGENEIAAAVPGQPALTCCVGPGAAVIVAGAHTTFFFPPNGPLNPGNESGVIVGQGPAPVYVQWNTEGVGNTWNSKSANCTGVGTPQANCAGAGEQGVVIAAPGQVPLPATLFLIGTGLVALGTITRRRASK